MRTKYRLRLKPPPKPLHDARSDEERALVAYRRKLNAQFISRRDTGQPIEPVYSHLKMVERRLATCRVWWT